MATPDKSGDGKTSPFGNGNGGGGTGGGSADLIKDPSGGRIKGSGANLLKDPGALVAGKSAGKDPLMEKPTQKTGAPPDECKESIPSGGRLPFPATKPSSERSALLGVGSIDGGPSGRKPFRLKGEGAAQEAAPAGSVGEDSGD